MDKRTLNTINAICNKASITGINTENSLEDVEQKIDRRIAIVQRIMLERCAEAAADTEETNMADTSAMYFLHRLVELEQCRNAVKEIFKELE